MTKKNARLGKKQVRKQKLKFKRLPWIDISPEVSERIAVFPGDQEFRRTISLDFKKGNHLLLSAVQTTLHLGAHADAPNHYSADGAGIAERSLDFYYGACQVIQVQLRAEERIMPHHLKKQKILSPRVLFRTDSFINPNSWTNKFNSLSPELIEELADRGVILVGIDTPSVDPANSKALESHQALRRRKLAVLEGIDLQRVKPGRYCLLALPLRLRDADASPVRAVLLPWSAKH